VKRIVNPQFPVHYTLGPEDVMAPGRALTGQVNASARASASGTVVPYSLKTWSVTMRAIRWQLGRQTLMSC